MNTELGRKVLDHVVTHREQFNMNIFGRAEPECGTSACLAGWALLLSGYSLNKSTFRRPDGTRVDHPGDEARDLLDLTDEQRYRNDAPDGNTLFTLDDDDAIAEFRALVEAAEAAAS